VLIASLTLQLLAGACCAVLAAITMALPTWIETVFGVDPDGGSGAAEWLIVGALTAGTVVAVRAAARTWSRIRTN